MRKIALLMSLELLPGLASAIPFYAADLSDGVLHEGQVDPAGWSNGPTAVDFFSYSGPAREQVSLLTRNESGVGGLLIALYAGTTESFAEFLATPSFIGQPFDWGGLAGLLQFEVAAGETLLQPWALPVTGAYTLIVGGSGFGAGEPIDYAVRALAVSEPAILVLLALGLVGVRAFAGGHLRGARQSPHLS